MAHDPHLPAKAQPIDDPGLAANPARLAWFEAARNALFWLPSFFLLFESRLPVDRVLTLAAIYYAASVALEVPSGYLSDRVGRRPTLVVGAALQALGCFTIAAADGFGTFAVGQACLAGAGAFFSGTDTSLLYESLRANGREAELVQHEARLQRVGLVALGLAALAGGFLASVDLRLPHALTGVASLVALGAALRLVEPPRTAASDRPRAVVRTLVEHVRQPVLAWTLAFAVSALVFNHVPFELLQPYVAAAAADAGLDVATRAPQLAGLALGATMLVAALASRGVLPLRRALGPAGTLLAALGLQTVVIGTLAVAVHPVLALFLVLRSVPQALAQPVVRVLVHPRVDGSLRATWLSLQSLAGRLAYAGALAAAAGAARGDERLDGPELLALLRVFAAAAVATVLGLALTRPRELRRERLD